MGLLKELRHIARFFGLGRDAALQAGERRLFEQFRVMTINDVRRRAAEFDASIGTVDEWELRRSQSSTASTSTQIVPEHIHGEPAKPWRDLEDHMRRSKAWEVSELSAEDQLRWAHRTKALSRVFVGPATTGGHHDSGSGRS